jgi:hypothetical protein
MLEVGTFTLVPNGDSRLELVAVAVDGQDPETPRAIWHAWTQPDDVFPSAGGWDWIGTPAGELAPTRPPTVAANFDGRLEVVVSGAEVWQTWQRTPGAHWAGWHSLGASPVPGVRIGASTLARNQDGRLELFTKVDDGSLWHRWQTRPGQGPWHDWHSLERPGDHPLGTPDAPPVLASNPDGRLEVFATADDGTLWHRWQTVPNGGWSAWSSLKAPDPGISGEPQVARNGDGRLELFTVASDGGVWHRWQSGPGGGPWKGWKLLDEGHATSSTQLAVGLGADGRLVVFVLAPGPGGGAELRQRQQFLPGWSGAGWTYFGRPADLFPQGVITESLLGLHSPKLVLDQRGFLQLWSQAPGLFGTTTIFYRLEEQLPSSGGWRHGLHAFPPPADPPYVPAPAPADQRM